METTPAPGERDNVMDTYAWASWLFDGFSNFRELTNGHYSFGVPLVLWMFDQQGVITLCEGEGLTALGLSVGETIGKSIFGSISQMLHKPENVRLALNGEHIEDFGEKDGLVWANWYCPIRNPKGEVTGVVCTSFNVARHWKQVHQQETVVKIAASLRQVDTRAEMFPVICDSVTDALNADATALVTRRTSDGQLCVDYENGIWASSNCESNCLEDHACLQKITEKIIDTGHPYIRNDWSYSSGSDERCAVAGVPFIIKGESHGALWVCRTPPISDDEVDLLVAIGDLAAHALYREVRHKQIESYPQRFVTLQAIERAVNEDLDLSIALSVLLDQVIKQLGVDAARIFLCDAKNKTLSDAAGRGFRHTKLEEKNLQFGEGLAGYVALRRRPFRTKDLSHPNHSLVQNSRIEHERFTSYCGIPLIFQGMLKGVLEVFHRQSFDMNKEWFDYLKDLAGKIAAAIDSAEQFDHILSADNISTQPSVAH